MVKPVPVKPLIIDINPNHLQKPLNLSYDPKDLGRFGFQSPAQMQEFLRSDSGKITQSIIAEVIQAELMQKQQQELDYQKLLRRRLYMIAALLLGLAYKKSAHAKLFQAITDRINKVKELNTPSKSATNVDDHSVTVKAYQDSLGAMNDAIATINKEATTVEDELFRLAKDQDRMDSQHELFDAYLEDIFSKSEDALKEILEATPEALENMMDEVHRLLENDQEEEAKALLDKHNAIIARRAATEEALCFKQGGAAFRFYDAEGNQMDSNNSETLQHCFAVPEKMGLVLVRTEANEFALLSPQHVENGKIAVNTPQNTLEAAKQAFKSHRPEIMAVHACVAEKKETERRVFEARCNPVLARADHLQKMIVTLENQTRDMQAGLSQLENIQVAPAPRPQATKTPTQMSATQPSISQSYRHLLRLMQLKPTSEQITRLEDTVKHNRSSDLSPEQKKELQTLKPGQRISPTQMARIMELLGNTGTSVTQQQQEVRSAPTPMKTVPSPFQQR